MRRTLFYLSVALLAFGIGSFIVFEFYWKTTEQSTELSVKSVAEETHIVSSTENQAKQYNEKINKYLQTSVEKICAETKCVGNGTFKPIIKEWLKGEELKNEPTSLWTLKKQQAYTEESALPSLVDLNADNNNELILQSDCAAVGNCQFDVFLKKGKGYSNLVSTTMVQVFEVLETSTNGFKDLHLRTHNSAFDSYHRLLKFDGRKYTQKKCWDESYEKLDEKGKWQELEEPIVTTIKCRNDF